MYLTQCTQCSYQHFFYQNIIKQRKDIMFLLIRVFTGVIYSVFPLRKRRQAVRALMCLNTMREFIQDTE